MALISFSTISDGTTGTASQVNTPLTTIYSDYNGNITDANIAAGAAIAVSKINTAALLAQLSNPYKFRVYRNAAQNTSAGSYATLLCDTKSYDTSSNVDVVTNKGRFTAPVAGFYQFNAGAGIASSSGTTGVGMALYKNGVVATYGTQSTNTTSTGSWYAIVGGALQLSANDYVEAYIYCNGVVAIDVGNVAKAHFSGFLISAT